MDHLFEAQKSLDIADYLLTKTLPVVGSPKMLLAILEDIHLSHLHMMKHLAKDDLPFAQLIQVLSGSHRSLVIKVKKIIDDHKDSDVEFERNGKFIICLDHYNLEELSVEDVKEYLFKSRELLESVTK